MLDDKFELIKLQSEICKTLSNPKRIEIVKNLCECDLSFSELLIKTSLKKSNLSQHMSLLLDKGIVTSVKAGKNLVYSLSDPKISAACSLMGEFLLEKLKKDSENINKLTS